ncbi:MAG: hypothetical protein ABSH06_27515 [Thermodesulfobacteriota bacterium]|jgi:hypothetical protein
MDEKTQQKVIAKIEGFLEKQRKTWYPALNVSYKRKSVYYSFDEMLKRDILYAGYVAQEFLVSLSLKLSPDGTTIDALFSYNNGDAATPSPRQSILNMMQQKGFVTNLTFSSNEKQTTESTDFYGVFRNKGKMYEIKGRIDGTRLLWFSILESKSLEKEGRDKAEKKKNEPIFATEIELKNWGVSIISEWLNDIQPIDFEWLTQNKTENKNQEFLLKALKEIAEIGIDASPEEENHVFRWREERLASQCTSSFILPRQDVEKIIEESKLKIPKDAELIGLSPYGENTQTPCLMARFIHLLPDKEFSSEDTGAFDGKTYAYQNPGKIVVEEDFCIFYIDPENRRVISEFRKWHPIKQA